MYENIYWEFVDKSVKTAPAWQSVCWNLDTILRGMIIIPVLFEYHYYPFGRAFIVYFAWSYKTFAFCFFQMQMETLKKNGFGGNAELPFELLIGFISFIFMSGYCNYTGRIIETMIKGKYDTVKGKEEIARLEEIKQKKDIFE